MKRLLAVNPVACLVLSFASIFLIVRTGLIVWQNYFAILFWDQWVMINDFIRDEAAVKSWTYLFEPHSDHVIATSKILFALDWTLFQLSNFPLVLSTMFFALIVAWLLAVLTFWEKPYSRIFWTSWLVFSAAGFSLAQWENLLWGFQPQFNFVLIGALISIIVALKVSIAEGRTGYAWLALLQIAMGFCAFSMANGIAISVPVVFLLTLFRAPPLKILITGALGIAYVVAFFLLTHGMPPLPTTAPPTLFGMLAFFFIMIGGAPFDAAISVAVLLGILVSAILTAFFVQYVILPWFRHGRVDSGLAGLFALAIFLFASAAAAATGRSGLGVSFALTSRYSTPMLVLWMTLFAVPIRLCLISQIFSANGNFRSATIWLTITAALGMVAVSTLRNTDSTGEMFSRSAALHEAAYFVVSDVLNANEAKVFYYEPEKIKGLVGFIREHKLNIFAPIMGLPVPSRDELQRLASIKSIPACTSRNIDSSTRIDAGSWKVSGWISNSERQTPRWIIASDDTGRQMGFTAPFVFRSDVESAIGAHHFRGFLLPVRVSEAAKHPRWIVAIFSDSDMCKVSLALH